MKQLFTLTMLCGALASQAQNISVTELGRYTDGREGACEITAYNAATKRIFITNAATDSIDIVDINDPAMPVALGGVDVTLYGGGINSIADLNNGYFAAAIEDTVKQDSGKIVFFNTNGTYVSHVKVGALPDMITMTKDGNKVLVANEGEPDADYVVDPEGSVSIIDISGGVTNLTQAHVTHINFTNAPTTIPGALKKPNTTWAVDLEPEYITTNSTSTIAAVVCQENNAVILIDLVNNSVLAYKGLGFKDHSLAGNGFDASNEDNGINIQNWNVKGAYQPDAITSFEIGGNTYFATANEGDARDYDGYSSEVRIKDLTLDPTAFPNAATLQSDAELGRLKTFTADMIGDTDGDGDVDELYSYGARSFSIWDATGSLVWDSGDAFEKYIEANHAAFFNCNDGKASKSDSRSDDKGPEPEAVTIGQIGTKTFAFIGLERQGGIMIYDVSVPTAPVFETFIHSFNTTTGVMTDIAPEGLVFVPASESHTNTNLLIASHEVSGTTTIYQINDLFSNINVVDGKNMDVRLYPNPTNDIINVEVTNNTTIDLTYTVTNMVGQVVLTGILNRSVASLNLVELPKGVYNLSLYNEAQLIKTERIVKF